MKIRTPLQYQAIPQTSDEWFRRIVSLTPGLITVYNLQTGKYLYINDSLKKILGYAQSEWYEGGIPFSTSLVHPDDLEHIIQRNSDAVVHENKKRTKSPQSDSIVSFEYRIRHKNGSWRWFKTDGIVFQRDTNGDVESVLNISIDITNRKEQELKEAAQNESSTDKLIFLARVTQSISDAVIGTTEDYIITSWNSAAERLYGWKEQEVLGKKATDVLHVRYIEGSSEEFRRAMQEKGYWNGEVAQTARNGKEVFVLASTAVVHDGKGDVIGYVAVNRDITGMKLIEEGQARLAAIVETSDDAIISKNLQGIIRTWNKAAERMFGYTAEEAIGKHITLIIPKELYHEEDTIIRNIKAGTPIHHYETVRVTKSGKPIQLSLSISPIKNKKGIVIGASKIARDITKQKELERQKDDFLAIASHELKTPVTSIKSFAQVLKLRFTREGNHTAAQLLGKMDGQIDKLTNLIGDLLDVTKIEAGKMVFNEQNFSFDELVQEIIIELQRTTEKHTILMEGVTHAQVLGDRERIGQVLTNLISNAIKYSPQADKILVEISKDTSSVQVCVRDYGLGIPKEKQGRIFERFYRVSGPGKDTYPGLGLGLYISCEIVQRSGGRIWVESEEGKGSLFCFTLPLSRHNKD